MNTQLPFFVYGTLRPGMCNYDRYLKNRTMTERTSILSGYGMYGDWSYPYILPAEDNDIVAGTLLTVDNSDFEEIAASLNFLEGYHGPDSSRNHYDRVEVTVSTLEGPANAYAYIASARTAKRIDGRLPRIFHGDWIRHEKETNDRFTEQEN